MPYCVPQDTYSFPEDLPIGCKVLEEQRKLEWLRWKPMRKRSLCHLETGRFQLVAEGGLDTHDTSDEAVLASWAYQVV
jgi:hypothetical protein